MGREKYDQLMSYIKAHQNEMAELTTMCVNDDFTDIGLLSAYYKIGTMKRAYTVLDKIDATHQTCTDEQLYFLHDMYMQALGAIQDFDNAITELGSRELHDEDDGECVDDSDDEYIIFDKIQNLKSSFKYYCEEIDRVYENVK